MAEGISGAEEQARQLTAQKADQIGMLATVMNCIYVSEIFRSVGMDTEIFTPFQCASFTELFSKDKAIMALESGKVIFLQAV